jgi:signal transduction histidine kinase
LITNTRWFVRYGATAIAVVAAFLVREGIVRLVGGQFPTYITFYPTVMLVALFAGVGPGIAATAVAALVTAYWILPPEGLRVATLPDAAGLALFATMGVFMSVVAGLYRGIRDNLEALVRERTAALAKASESLRRSEESLRQLNESLERRVVERTVEVQRQARQVRALAMELTRAEQRERQRLAAILHDNVQQLLAAAQMRLSVIDRADDAAFGASVESVRAIIRQAVNASRSLAMDLNPPVLRQAGLAAALAWLAERMSEMSQFRVDVLADAGAEPASEEVRTLLFESVRELLLNVVKHAGVKEARIAMARADTGRTTITIEDSGVGFDPASIIMRTTSAQGLGLSSVQQRMIRIGGGMEIDSAPGRGTRIKLVAPAETAAAAP